MQSLPRLLVLVVALAAFLPTSAGARGGAPAFAEPADVRAAQATEQGSPPTAPERPAPAPNRLMLGYYVPYDPTSWATLEAQAHLVDVVAAQWATVDACGQLSSRDDQTLKQFARSRGIQVYPSLLTMSGWLNHRILTEESVTATAISQIVEYVVAEGYDGFDLDLEGIRPEDRAAYSSFVARLGAALRERGKPLALAIPAKAAETTTGWAGAYDYAALGQHADLITIMAYEFRGSWSGPGSVAPYDWVERVAAFSTSQIPPEKVLLGLAFYGYDWNTTSGGARSLTYPQAVALAEHHGVPIVLDETTRSATFRYRTRAGDPVPTSPRLPPLQHEITVRTAPPCAAATPEPAATPTPRPAPAPGTLQEHEVWLEESAGAAARLELAARYGTGGVAAWRLGQEDPRFWPILEHWRAGPASP